MKSSVGIGFWEPSTEADQAVTYPTSREALANLAAYGSIVLLLLRAGNEVCKVDVSARMGSLALGLASRTKDRLYSLGASFETTSVRWINAYRDWLAGGMTAEGYAGIYRDMQRELASFMQLVTRETFCTSISKRPAAWADAAILSGLLSPYVERRYIEGAFPTLDQTRWSGLYWYGNRLIGRNKDLNGPMLSATEAEAAESLVYGVMQDLLSDEWKKIWARALNTA